MTAKVWKPSTLAEAKANALVNMTAPSGARYSVRPMTLDEVVAADGMPDDLVRVAFLDSIPGALAAEMAQKIRAGDTDATAKLSRDLVELRNRLVLAAVQAPKLKAKDLPELDPYDLEDIAAVAQHRRIVEPVTS